MHIDDSCTRDGDNLFKTGNALKQFCQKLQSILLKSMKGEGSNTVKSDSGGQIVSVFTITEIN